MARPMERPKLSMPEAEVALLSEAYGEAGVILEFGAGGSTLLAAEMEGKRVFAVESDLGWLRRMERWFATHPPLSAVVLHHGNIGPTTDWGRPDGEAHWRKFLGYPLGVWDREDFDHPDVVLIDGRFRVGCFLATMLRITRPVVVLFDDFVGRRPYGVVEEFARPARLVGRMAKFDVVPTVPAPQDFLRWVKLMQRPV